MYDYFIKLLKNGIAISSFNYPKEKEMALSRLLELYLEYKQKHFFADDYDLVDFAIKNYEKELSKYSEIFVDNFKIGSVNLIESKKEQELVELILNHKHSKKLQLDIGTTDATLYHEVVFDSYDEIRKAMKIAKKLLLQGASAKDIIIVSTDFSTYQPTFYNLLDEYGMKGYDNMGIPLNVYSSNLNELKYHNDFQVRKAYGKFFIKFNELKDIYKHFSLQYNEDGLKRNLLKNIKVNIKKEGIELIEINKLLGSTRRFKHIILVGTDITRFPPKSRLNFLYTQEESEELFNTNNIFAASQTLYNELKKIGENLYILTASYEGKRELSPSIIIDKNINNSFNTDDIKSRNDIVKSKHTIEDDSLESYCSAVLTKTLTEYDGIINQKFTNGNNLSASSLNTYAKCPLQYYFSNVLELKAPEDEKEGFDAAGKGILLHKCFEIFVKDAQIKDYSTFGKKGLYDYMFEVSKRAYNSDEIKNLIGYDRDGNLKENINHKVELKLLQKGLDDPDSKHKAELAKFIDYFLEDGEKKVANKFEWFKNSHPEEEFFLDKDFKPTTKEEERFIRGFIDRLDELEDSINIIDYKSSVKNKKIDDIKLKSLKDYQLGLYMLYATQNYPNKSKYQANLLSFKEKSYNDSIAIPYTKRKPYIEFDDNYKEVLKSQINQIKECINNGKFGFNNEDEKVCEYCNFAKICHQDILEKEILSFCIKKVNDNE